MAKLTLLFFSWFVLFATLSSAWAQEHGDSLPIEDSIQAEAGGSTSSYGVTPIAAYGPTYGLIVGGAGFIFPKSGRLGLDTHLIVAELPSTGQMDVSFSRANDWTKQWGYNLEGTYNNFFTSFYGEGDQTPKIAQEFNQHFYRAHEGVLFHFSEVAALESFVETRSRTDLGLTTDPTHHLTPNETRSIFGVAFTHDTRDSLVNTRTGHYALAQLQTAVSGGNTPNFQQLELEYRQFYSLGNRWVLGLRTEAATSNGTPSYNYQYNLGGIERLRGYLHNRFRGNQYYLGGYEVRKDLIGNYLQVVTFADAGDTKDQSYAGPRAALGVGIRVGLPPDWGMKFRIDYAQGGDQKGFFATFGQAF